MNTRTRHATLAAILLLIGVIALGVGIWLGLRPLETEMWRCGTAWGGPYMPDGSADVLECRAMRSAWVWVSGILAVAGVALLGIAAYVFFRAKESNR